jgi:hypothetical protein
VKIEQAEKQESIIHAINKASEEANTLNIQQSDLRPVVTPL